MGCALCGGCQCQCDWYSHLCFQMARNGTSMLANSQDLLIIKASPCMLVVAPLARKWKAK